MYLILIMYYNIIYFLYYYAILGVIHDECISGT